MIDVSFSIFFISFPFFHRCVGECYSTVELYTKAPFIASAARHNRRFTQVCLLKLDKEKAATLSDDGYSEKKKSLLKAVEQMTEEQAELLLSFWEQFKVGR